MATIQMCLGALDRIMPTSSSLKNTNRLLGWDEVSLDLAKSLRSKTSRNKVRAHRKRLRQQGLRPIRIWVPGMRSPALAAEEHRQSLAVARSPHAKEDQDFINAVSDWAQVEARGNLDCSRW